MAKIQELFGRKSTPPEVPQVENHSWFAVQPSNTAIIFVHGVLSNSRDCWYDASSGSYWPQLVKDDGDFPKYSIYLGGFYTGFDSTHYSIRDCALELFDNLQNSSGTDEKPSVASHDQLIFVCHSLGGIVTRYMLVNFREKFEKKKIGIFLVASPSLGSHYAGWLSKLSRALNHSVGQQLEYRSSILTDLDQTFQDLLNKRYYRALVGREIAEHFMIAPAKNAVLRFLTRSLAPAIVPPPSAFRYFGDPRTIPGSDHFSIAKPSSLKHPSHDQLRSFVTEFGKHPEFHFKGASPEPKQPKRSPLSVLRAKRITWQISITEDGDAMSQLKIETTIEANQDGKARYRLPDSWTSAGEITQYFRSSECGHGVILESMDCGGAYVWFEDPPSDKNPYTIAIDQGNVRSSGSIVAEHEAPSRDLRSGSRWRR